MLRFHIFLKFQTNYLFHFKCSYNGIRYNYSLYVIDEVARSEALIFLVWI